MRATRRFSARFLEGNMTLTWIFDNETSGKRGGVRMLFCIACYKSSPLGRGGIKLLDYHPLKILNHEIHKKVKTLPFTEILLVTYSKVHLCENLFYIAFLNICILYNWDKKRSKIYISGPLKPLIKQHRRKSLYCS